jgi:hypothetical protein
MIAAGRPVTDLAARKVQMEDLSYLLPLGSL